MDLKQEIITQSACMKEVSEMIGKVALTSSNVLIYGESGTGKELAARSVHAGSPRAHKRFVPVNCASLPRNLAESELFGCEKGAFTGAHARNMGKFEYAAGGTLFLDEISCMSGELQSKLLRVVQEREIVRLGGQAAIPADVRLIAATNNRPEEMVRDGSFREDLYFRLNVVQAVLPPLRERKGDIPLLAEFFLDRFNREMNRKIKGITSGAMALLETHSWPGNVRELKNLTERMVVLGTDGEMINEETLRFHRFQGNCGYPDAGCRIGEREGECPACTAGNADDSSYTGQERRIPGEGDPGLAGTLRAFERRFVLNTLVHCKWNRTEAARRLKIHRNTLARRMKALDITDPGKTV